MSIDDIGSKAHQEGDAFWGHVMALFDLVVESTDPDTLLAAEPNAEIREAAARLWRHHLSAAKEEFLERTIEFTVLPIFTPGQVLVNRFEVERLIGQGGMGEVYLARDRNLGELVALKTISRLLAPSRQIRRRFVAEVQNARRISHLNVCRIHELFDEGEIVFFAMEYVNGSSLNELLTGRLSKAEAHEITLQLAEGLHAAHRSGVVHGDLKPSNVLIVPGTLVRAVIMDFGLARALRTGSDDPGHGEPVGAGTLDYMAPELIAGSPPSVASDVFAFGKVARQLLPKEKLWDVCAREHPGERPRSLEPVIRRLRRDTTRRYWIGGAALVAASAPLYSILSHNPSVRLESGARLLVNGFQAAEKALPGARLVRSLLITALQQSPQIRTIADQDLLPTLQRLSPGATFPVAGDVLTRLLKIQRASHWIDGVLSEANGRLSLALRVWRTSDQRLHSQVSFGDAPAVTALAEQTALWMRQLAGESHRSLVASPTGVTAYTSAVPEALQNYYDAMERFSLGRPELAIPLLKEALRLDPGFAQALNALGMCLNSERKHVEALECVERARQLEAKLPERERAWVEAFYQELVQDPVKMVEATRTNMELHPDEPRFCRIFAQTLCWVGRAAESIPYIEKAVELAPENDLLRNERTMALCEAGRFVEGLATAESNRARSNNPYLGRGTGLALLGLGRYDEAYSAFETVPGDSRLLQAGARILIGDIDSAIVALRQELAAQRTQQNPAGEHRVKEFLCGAYYLTDRLDLARTHVRSMIPLPECPAIGLQLQCTAFWAARLGEDQVLSAAGMQLERIAGRWPNGFTHATLVHARALESWRLRDVQRAESYLLDSLGSAFTIFALFDLADLLAATARPVLAEEYWRKFEDRHGTVLRKWFTGMVLHGWLNRGLAARMRGDREVASVCASNILKHWARRHPGIRLVQKAKELSAA